MTTDLKGLLEEVESQRFYGSLELKYEAGRVVLIRKCETFKPTGPGYGDNRGSNEHSKS